jgi:MFS family permease
VSLRPAFAIALFKAILGGFLTSTIAFVGWIADRRGWRRPAWTFGLLSLMACIVMLVASTELWVLVLSRILQGISGAGISPTPNFE